MPPAVDPAVAFWRHVRREPDGCLTWTGAKARGGYGNFSAKGKTVKAHRFAYEMANGRIPAGMQIDHLCRYRACVEATHLEAVTQRENVLRGVSPVARRARRKTCIRGHEDWAVWGGTRHCRTCAQMRRSGLLLEGEG